MAHWATQLPAWFWVVVGFILGVWTAYFIARLHELIHNPATAASIRQLKGGITMPISGIKVGGAGKFQATFNGALQAGAVPVWASDLASIALTPAADGLTVDASAAAGETAGAFNLSVSAVASDGSAVSGSVTVPILPAPATAVTIDQIA